eukprot:ANDGO_01700.mRNA.1 Putative glucosylceramidase 4
MVVVALSVMLSVLCTLCAAQNIRVVQTAFGTSDRMTELPSVPFGPDFPSLSTVSVDANSRFQSILGFGGAFTEAAAINYAALTLENKKQLIEMYFGASGIGYTLGRVPMNSCDFSPATYSFDDTAGDFNLTHFDSSVHHDTQTMIPFIQAAMKGSVNPIRLFLSPWSPPAWMKVPQDGVQTMISSASPVGLLQECEPVWAQYFSKFITAYSGYGIKFWGLTVNNEPEFAAPWEACKYTPEYERDFVKNHLGPVMRNDHPDVKIMVYDHNRDHIADWAQVIYSDPQAAQYVDGIAFHWYMSNNYGNLVKAWHTVQAVKPGNAFLLNTEGCNCPPSPNSWAYAESYAQDIINDLNSFAAGFVDWNLMVDLQGGPNHLKNWCDAMFEVDTASGVFYVQPSYYYMGQISKFVVPNSVRIGLDLNISFANVPVSEKPNVGDGDNVFLWACDASPRQRFTSTFSLENSNMCLDIQDKSTADGANVQVWDCSGGSNQQWSYDAKSRFLTAKLDGKCLALEDKASFNGVNIVVKNCDANDLATQWIFDAVHGTLHSALDTSFCAMVAGPMVTATAVTTPQGQTVVVIQNMLESTTIDYKVKDGNKAAKLSIAPHSIQTLIYQS